MDGFDQPLRELVRHFATLKTDEGLPAVSLAGLHAELCEDLGDIGEGHALPTFAQFVALGTDPEACSSCALQLHTYLWRCYQRTVCAEWTPAPSWLATPPTVGYARKGWHVYRPRSGERIV